MIFPIIYLFFHVLCISICTAVTFKETEHILPISRRFDERFFPILASTVAGPLAIIFIVGYYSTRSAIENMDPEMKKLKKKVDDLQGENADLNLKMNELDSFVRELQR
jgi:hypothetical protein